MNNALAIAKIKGIITATEDVFSRVDDYSDHDREALIKISERVAYGKIKKIMEELDNDEV